MLERVDTFFYTTNDDAESCIASQQARGYFCEKIAGLHGVVIHTYRRLPQ